MGCVYGEFRRRMLLRLHHIDQNIAQNWKCALIGLIKFLFFLGKTGALCFVIMCEQREIGKNRLNFALTTIGILANIGH
jgi:hypothetical protein